MAVHHFVHKIWPQGPPPPLPRGFPSVEPFCFPWSTFSGIGWLRPSCSTTHGLFSLRPDDYHLWWRHPTCAPTLMDSARLPPGAFPAPAQFLSSEVPYKGRTAACPGLPGEVMTCPDPWRYEVTGNVGPRRVEMSRSRGAGPAARPWPASGPGLAATATAAAPEARRGPLHRPGSAEICDVYRNDRMRLRIVSQLASAADAGPGGTQRRSTGRPGGRVPPGQAEPSGVPPDGPGPGAPGRVATGPGSHGPGGHGPAGRPGRGRSSTPSCRVARQYTGCGASRPRSSATTSRSRPHRGCPCPPARSRRPQ